MQGTDGSDRSPFAEAVKAHESVLSRVELRCLLWLAGRLPAWVSPDHLTLVGLAASVGMGVFYFLARFDRRALLAVSFLLAVNWFGDSLNGTVARVRRQVRPRYGFYIDHVVDTIGAVFMLGGLSLSGLMSPGIAAGLLIAFLLLSVEVYIATYTVGVFEMTHWRVGPTEIRIAQAAFNLVVYWYPAVMIQDRSYLLFDLFGGFGVACGVGMFLAALYRNLRILHRVDPPKP